VYLFNFKLYQHKIVLRKAPECIKINKKICCQMFAFFSKSAFFTSFFILICWNIHNFDSKNVVLDFVKLSIKTDLGRAIWHISKIDSFCTMFSSSHFVAICQPISCLYFGMGSMYSKLTVYFLIIISIYRSSFSFSKKILN
jgi:hypothetical protein